MFTGIISDVGTIVSIDRRGDVRARIATAYDTAAVDLGASIACSGACLTVVDKGPGWFAVDISAETVARTAPGIWREGGRLNLERALRLGDELGGHIVTGHVDGIGTVVSAEDEGDSRRIVIAVPPELAAYVAPKGSITLDGISLTVNTVEDVAGDPESGGASRGDARIGLNIIPHTAQATTFDRIEAGRAVHLEIDVLARYLGRMEQLRHVR